MKKLEKNKPTKSIKAFGKLVDRETAYQIIINDKICDICHARNTDSLEDLLIMGCDSLLDWSNSELESCIEGLSIGNQPKEFLCKLD